MKSCPKCSIQLMPKTIGPVEVDECQKCKGIWFDKTELWQAKNTTDSDLNWMDFEIWKHEDSFKARASEIKCPVCKTPAQTIGYGATAVEVDYCPKCRGVWLDKNEFKKIIESLEQELVSKTFSEYIKTSIEEAKELITSPESFMSEWEDFSTVLRMMQYRMFVENPKLLDTVTLVQRANPFK